ncbi:MAG: hypothetical protein FWD68_15995 [Alphaproteobacteria bacterium]|nr:hypothetical protein [Alphaproteobacteria bacterium]
MAFFAPFFGAALRPAFGAFFGAAFRPASFAVFLLTALFVFSAFLTFLTFLAFFAAFAILSPLSLPKTCPSQAFRPSCNFTNPGNSQIKSIAYLEYPDFGRPHQLADQRAVPS